MRRHTSAVPSTLVLCSKSRWSPAIRREHALARLAVADGIRVVFIEQPRDVRALLVTGRGAWLAALAGSAPGRHAEDGVEVIPRSTLVPPHWGRLAWITESVLLGRSIPNGVRAGATLLATTPWQWRAIARVPGVRRVFDCADDWSSLLPRRAEALAAQYRRIGLEADAVIVNARPLARLFSPRHVDLVPNGAGPELLATPVSPPPSDLALVYAGTLSERFDVSLVAGILERLGGWRLDLYGESRYAGRGGRPGSELRELLARFPDRVSWHGPVERTELTARLDAGRVLVLPHRRVGAVTGDAMKLYDYAARGRPIVSTRWSDLLAEDAPPSLRLADTPDEFAAAVRSAADESPDVRTSGREWAESRSWDHRWPAWSQAAFGA
jgi:Glycosyl transferases group 1